MKLKSFLFALIVLIGGTVAGFAETAGCAGIEAGTKAYNEGEFERAIDEWQNCIDNGFQNADLYYNLGNAYFRNGQLGLAIYNYKVALKLRPNDDDFKHNLEYAQAMTKDKVDDEEENPILSTLYKAHHAMSLKAQLFTLLALFWLIAIVSVLRILVHGDRAKNACMGAVFIVTIVFGLMLQHL